MTDGWLLPQLFQHGVALLGTALVINTVFTFVGTLGLALLAVRVAGSPRLAKLILLTPWLRVAWDLAAGASANAYVLSEHAGMKGALGSFQLGIGATLVPVVTASLDMQGGEQRYRYSVGDMLGHWLYRHVGATPLVVMLCLLFTVSTALLVARAWHYLYWRRVLRRAEAVARRVDCVSLRLRKVQVLTRDEAACGAFTSGVLAPRVWLPEGLVGSQRQAVLEHELAHARDADVLWFGVVGVLSDVFWFVPGARWLERRLHDQAEQAADTRALAHGVEPQALAHSILAQAASPLPDGPPPRMAGTASRLEQRLLALGKRHEPRTWKSVLRLVVAASLTLSVFKSVFGGYS